MVYNKVQKIKWVSIFCFGEICNVEANIGLISPLKYICPCTNERFCSHIYQCCHEHEVPHIMILLSVYFMGIDIFDMCLYYNNESMTALVLLGWRTSARYSGIAVEMRMLKSLFLSFPLCNLQWFFWRIWISNFGLLVLRWILKPNFPLLWESM